DAADQEREHGEHAAGAPDQQAVGVDARYLSGLADRHRARERTAESFAQLGRPRPARDLDRDRRGVAGAPPHPLHGIERERRALVLERDAGVVEPDDPEAAARELELLA